MGAIFQRIVAVLAAFLPARYAGEVSRRDGLLSGLAETFVALLVLVLTAVGWLHGRTNFDFKAAAAGGLGIPGSGIFVLAEFWLKPVHVLLFYFILEGMFRTLAALVGQQVIGLVPLYLVSGIHGVIGRRKYERSLGPLVADEIRRGTTRGEFDLKVYSCRPKLHWNPYMTIEFEGEFYQYFNEEYGNLPRRFIYYLRRNPIGRVVVVIDRYTADTVLKPGRDKWKV